MRAEQQIWAVGNEAWMKLKTGCVRRRSLWDGVEQARRVSRVYRREWEAKAWATVFTMFFFFFWFVILAIT